MKIYTKGGDAGLTGLVGGMRVPKDDHRIQTYGTLDELNAVVGIVLSDEELPSEIRVCLFRLQNELFQLGAELATPSGSALALSCIQSFHVDAIEKEIDAMQLELPPLKTFILPGGTHGSAWVHFARTVSRRAERELVAFNRVDPVRPVILQYLNRMSDYLFVIARYLNHLSQVSDIPWIAPK